MNVSVKYSFFIALCLLPTALHAAGGEDPETPETPPAGVEETPLELGKAEAPESGEAGEGVTIIKDTAGDFRAVRPGSGAAVTGEASPVDGLPEEALGGGRRLHQIIPMLVARQMTHARAAMRKGQLELVIDLCNDVLRIKPNDPEATHLRALAQKTLASQERKVRKLDRATTDQGLLNEVEDMVPPPRMPELHRPKAKDNYAVESEAMKAMQRKLDKPIGLNFVDVPLDFLLEELSKIAGVNIIADPEVLADKRLKIRVYDLPIRDVLQFIARQYDDVDFQITDRAIWVTGSQTPMLVPKIYYLKYGLVRSGAVTSSRSSGTIRNSGTSQAGTRVNSRLPGGGQGNAPSRGGGGGGTRGTGQGQNSTYLEEILNNWVVTWSDWPEDGQILLDRKTNSLFVMTTVEMHKRLAQLLQVIDKPPVQVMIRSAFIEVSMDDGSGWGLNFNNVASQSGQVRLQSATGTNLVTPSAIGNVTIAGVGTNPTFSLAITAFEQNENSRLMSAPQTMAINNQEAFMQVKDFFQYPTRLEPVNATFRNDTTTDSEPSAFVPADFQDEAVGFELRVTPSVGSDYKTIVLDLHPMVDSVEGGTGQFAQYDVIGSDTVGGTALSLRKPVIKTQEFHTRVIVEDGHMIAIGGLMRNDEVTTLNKVPFLGDIPLLGLLFQSENKSTVRSNLIILVTAEIVHPSGRRYTDTPDSLRRGVGVDEAAPESIELVPTQQGWATMD